MFVMFDLVYGNVEWSENEMFATLEKAQAEIQRLESCHWEKNSTGGPATFCWLEHPDGHKEVIETGYDEESYDNE